MIKTIIFRCKLDGLSLNGVEELKALLEKVGVAIQSVHSDALIDPSVEVGQVEDGGINAVLGAAGKADGYYAVKKTDGSRRYFFAPNNGLPDVELTKDEYDAVHAHPKMQAQLKNAHEIAGTTP